MSVISVKGVSKRYRIFPSGRARMKEALTFGKRKYGRDFWALKDVDLEVNPGTTLGILGRNGAGKSTLLNVISGILQPTTGTVEVDGRLMALFGLGAGFNPEFTGRENVMLNGLILGMEREEILERFEDIVALADIGDFMDQPIKTYSSGMRSRLGFAVAVNVEPDVLVLDETLAVGDAVYKQTALQKMYEMRDSGTTILFVSHSMKMVEEFCTEAILLHEGRLLASGETAEIIDRYQALVSNIRAQKKRRKADGEPSPEIVVPDEEAEGLEDLAFEEDQEFDGQVSHPRDGKREARIRRVEVLDEHLHPIEEIDPDSTTTIRVHLEYLETVKDSEIVITLCNRAGLEVFSTSTTLEGVQLEEMEKGEQAIVDFIFKLPLQQDRYSVTAAVRAGSKSSYLHQVDTATIFKITRPQNRSPFRGVVHLPTEIKVHALGGERQNRSA